MLGYDLSARQAPDRQVAVGPKVTRHNVDGNRTLAAGHAQPDAGVIGRVPKPPAAEFLHVVKPVAPFRQQEVPLEEPADMLAQPLRPCAIYR